MQVYPQKERNAFTSSSDVLVKIGQAMYAILTWFTMGSIQQYFTSYGTIAYIFFSMGFYLMDAPGSHVVPGALVGNDFTSVLIQDPIES